VHLEVQVANIASQNISKEISEKKIFIEGRNYLYPPHYCT
jgi:hypothetical protein